MPLTKTEADTLIDAVKSLVAPRMVRTEKGRRDGHTQLTAHDGKIETVDPHPATSPAGRLRIDTDQVEAIYRDIKNRLLDDLRVDPILLQLIAQRPEIVLEIEPVSVTLDAKTMKGRIAMLLSRAWFKERRATSAVRRELARTGPDPGGGGTLSEKLSELQREGFLTREGDGWIEAPGIKISEREVTR